MMTKRQRKMIGLFQSKYQQRVEKKSEEKSLCVARRGRWMLLQISIYPTIHNHKQWKQWRPATVYIINTRHAITTMKKAAALAHRIISHQELQRERFQKKSVRPAPPPPSFSLIWCTSFDLPERKFCKSPRRYSRGKSLLLSHSHSSPLAQLLPLLAAKIFYFQFLPAARRGRRRKTWLPRWENPNLVHFHFFSSGAHS